MKFSDYSYVRPDMQQIETGFTSLLERFDNAATFAEQDQILLEINKLRSDFESMRHIAYIRHLIDTREQFYEDEQNFFDENMPIYQGILDKYYQSLIKSKFRPMLEAKWGKHLFDIADVTLKTFTPEVIEDMQLENKLGGEHPKILSGAKVFFEGQERTLAQLEPFQQSADRATRKRALEAKCSFFKEHDEKLGQVYDDLVKIRTKIARKLGYKNFVELGYARMKRTDYTPEMVANFRKQVLEHIVPVASKLRERQRQRLGLDTLKYFDEKISFKSGNANPQGDPEWIIANGKRMYAELSPETHEFFDFMVERELMDLVSKEGKVYGGCCVYFDKFKSPFIFSNFNGTAGDIEVLTHEAGHAFQAYASKDFEIIEYHEPSLEACEIHSMSMEFFTWPWMEMFFKEQINKFKFTHLSEALLFIPYGVTVDEYQHFVYENPDATPKERKQAWRAIEKKYLPHRDFDDIEFLNDGSFWYFQGHIFEVPFYYIDYTLAQICAFQFWKRMMENDPMAWPDYLRLCKAGGSNSFTNLVKLANLVSPFEDGCVQSVMGVIEQWLNGIDDTRL